MKLHQKVLILYVLIHLHWFNLAQKFNDGGQVLSRHRRHVVFPQGSSFSAALCMSIQAYTRADPIFTEGVNWGVAYDLPNDTRTDLLPEFQGIRHILMRKRRSDLYQKLETVLDSGGFNGKSCIYRTLCESSQKLSQGKNLISEMLHILFKFPQEGMSHLEPEMHSVYNEAYKLGSHNEICEMYYDECPFSILDMAQYYFRK